MSEQLHETLSREHAVKQSSDRSFGVVFAIVFLLIGLWPLPTQGQVRWWSVALSVIFFSVAIVRPAWLAPLNKAWARFGRLLHHVVNPVIMAGIFYFTVVPTGLILRLCKKDPLRIRLDPAAESYWIAREPPGPSPETMKNQF